MDTISSLKLADLKRELRARNLPITGTKQILVDRLLEAMSAEKAAADDSNIDDLLDEDSMLGEEESDAGSDENVVGDITIASPTATAPPPTILSTSPSKAPAAVKRSAPSPAKTGQNGTASIKEGSPPSKKKIILNREPIPEEAPQILPPVTAEAVAAKKTVSDGKRDSIDSTGDKAVIKLSDASSAPITDKLKLRQEKFGSATLSTSDVADKLKQRANRFGVSGSASSGPGKASLTPEDQAKLAKRQERFGLTADSKVDEMKNRRAERFGLGTKTTPENAAEVEEKKKQRAARFAAAL